MENQQHNIAPIYNEESEILILGSFPSVKSREIQFYYGHPQNRFWKVISTIFNAPLPVTTEEKTKFLLDNHIALWDVIASCEIHGSSDSSIKNVVPNDISLILNNSNVEIIYVNGKTAEKYYKKYLMQKTGKAAICLPSTSPANASNSTEMLIEKWKMINPQNQ